MSDNTIPPKRGRGRPRKTAPSTASMPELVPQANGGALLSGGMPGNKGGPGRPPKAFKAFCAALASDLRMQDKLETAALNGDLNAIKLVVNYAEGMPTQAIEHSGNLSMTREQRVEAVEVIMREALIARQGGRAT